MRKHITNYTLVLILLLTISCKSDEINYPKSVEGEWYQEAGEIENSNTSFRNEIIFRNDGTYEEAYLLVETDNPEQIVGYQHLFIGEYEVAGNILRRFNMEQYGLDNQSNYLDWEELVLQDSSVIMSEVELSFNKSADQLTFDHCPKGPCPAYVSYIEFQVYYRSR